MNIKILNPASLAEPRGYNNGILVEGGSLLFVAGQIGWDQDCRIVSEDFAAQFKQALQNVLAVVLEAGGNPANIARLLIFVVDRGEYQRELKEVGVAYRELMGRHFPAMTLVEVSALLEKGAKVEIEAMAVL
jgi:enamine deaminase RidA (YjgF/YER057c/UK114 family)